MLTTQLQADTISVFLLAETDRSRLKKQITKIENLLFELDESRDLAQVLCMYHNTKWMEQIIDKRWFENSGSLLTLSSDLRALLLKKLKSLCEVPQDNGQN